MSNELHSVLTKASHAPREGVLIPRKQVQKMRRARDLVEQARRHARDIAKEARQQAAEVRRQAHAAGYQDGALAAASHVLAHFSATQALAQRLRDELEQHARILLGAALDHPDTVLALLVQCLLALAGAPNQRIAISLPSAMRGSRARVQALLEQAGYGVDAANIDYRDDARMAVLAGEQVFEFDQCESIAGGQAALLRQFPDLAEASRGLGEAAMQQWRDAFEQRFAASGEEAGGGDGKDDNSSDDSGDDRAGDEFSDAFDDEDGEGDEYNDDDANDEYNEYNQNDDGDFPSPPKR